MLKRGLLAILAGMWTSLATVLSNKELNLERAFPQAFADIFVLLGTVITVACIAYGWRCAFLVFKRKEGENPMAPGPEPGVEVKAKFQPRN